MLTPYIQDSNVISTVPAVFLVPNSAKPLGGKVMYHGYQLIQKTKLRAQNHNTHQLIDLLNLSFHHFQENTSKLVHFNTQHIYICRSLWPFKMSLGSTKFLKITAALRNPHKKYNLKFSTVLPDVLAPLGAGPFACIVMATLVSHVYKGLALEGSAWSMFPRIYQNRYHMAMLYR